MLHAAEKLINTVPKLWQNCKSGIQWWGEEKPGVHIVFGELLNPYLVSLLESEEQEEILRRIFAFLEELANHRDTQIQEVVAVTVCERLGDSKELLLKARKHMGEKTLSFSQEIEAFWHKEDI